MKTFKAKIEVPGKGAKFISNCTIYKGKLAQVIKKGVGAPRIVGGFTPGGDGDVWEEFDRYEDSFVAYVNSSMIPTSGLTQDQMQKMLKKDESVAFTDERIFKCLFVMGENPGGYFVHNQDEIEAAREADAERKEAEAFANKSVEIGFMPSYFGLIVTMRLPSHIWQLIKPFATYHDGGESDQEWADDMGYFNADKRDLKGWYYSKEAMQALIDSGYKVAYRGCSIAIISQIDEVNKSISDQQLIEQKARNAYNNAKQQLINKRHYFSREAECMKAEETDYVGNLPQILFPAIEVSGQTIYGGGMWFHADENYLYIVQNNGHDGDNWSWNNYRTGGAGAICKRFQMCDEVREFITEAEAFEGKSVESYL